MLKQLPQLDLTFGIGDIVGSIALLASAFTFYISYSQAAKRDIEASQSEQIKTSRELWAGIIAKYEQFKEDKFEAELNEDIARAQSDPDIGVELARTKIRRKVNPMFAEIDYFGYLISRGEINDKVVLGYYRDQLIDILEYCMNRYVDFMMKTYPVKPRFEEPNERDRRDRFIEQQRFNAFSANTHIVELLEFWKTEKFKEELAKWKVSKESSKKRNSNKENK
jgi:hypothetical protein